MRRSEDGPISKAKINNSPAAHLAKIELRRRVLESMDAASARVFDAFAGDGAMWRGAWRGAAHYVGCDLEWYRDEREAFVADNRRVLRAIDLGAFNIFDLDAWGSPWEQALIIAARRALAPGERIGFALTEGSAISMVMHRYSPSLAEIADLRGNAAGALRVRGEVIDRALGGLYRRMKARPVRRWEAHGTTGAKMVYIGLIIEGL